MLEDQTIAVEFADSGRGDEDPGWVREFKDIESKEEGLAEGGYHAVVRRGSKC